jgi:hypothetical protein
MTPEGLVGGVVLILILICALVGKYEWDYRDRY